MVEQISLEYLAGFFDGEGTFYIGKQVKNGKEYPHCTVMLSQSGDAGLALFDLIQSQYGGKIYKHLKAGQHMATKDAYKLYWNKAEAITLIPKLLPYLKIKNADAWKAYKYLTREKS